MRYYTITISGGQAELLEHPTKAVRDVWAKTKMASLAANSGLHDEAVLVLDAEGEVTPGSDGLYAPYPTEQEYDTAKRRPNIGDGISSPRR